MRKPLREPVAEGENVTLIVQFALVARELPQVLVCAKSPLVKILSRYNVAVPVFESVIVFTAPVVPRFSSPQLNEVGDKLAAAPLLPIPTSNTTWLGFP